MRCPKKRQIPNPDPRQSAPFIPVYLREPWNPWSNAQGVAKSVCHRDRRSLSNRQLRCLCRTDFGSPYIIRVNLREPLEPKPVLSKNVWSPGRLQDWHKHETHIAGSNSKPASMEFKSLASLQTATRQIGSRTSCGQRAIYENTRARVSRLKKAKYETANERVSYGVSRKYRKREKRTWPVIIRW